MIRKLIMQGKQAYTVTLPVEWIRANNLEAGSEISLQPAEDKVIITSSKQAAKKKSITLNLEDNHFNLFLATLTETYTLGYNRIIIHSAAKDVKKHLEKITSQYFLGFELTQQNASSYTIENISEPDGSQFDTIMRKMFLLCTECFKEIIDNIGKIDTEKSEEIKKKLGRMEQYNNFCRRCMTQKVALVESVPQIWLVLSFLIKFKRSFMYLIDACQRQKIKENKNYKNIFYALHNGLSEVYSAYYTGDIEKANKVYERNKELLLREIRPLLPKSQNENILMFHIIEFQRLINYITAPVMAVSIGKKHQL